MSSVIASIRLRSSGSKLPRASVRRVRVDARMLHADADRPSLLAITNLLTHPHKLPAAWFFVGDFLVKLCFRYSFKQILRLFWVGKKVLRFM